MNTKPITVGELRKAMADLPEETPVGIVTAEYDEDYSYWHVFGKQAVSFGTRTLYGDKHGFFTTEDYIFGNGSRYTPVDHFCIGSCGVHETGSLLDVEVDDEA